MSNEHPTPPHQPSGRPGPYGQPGQYGPPAAYGQYDQSGRYGRPPHPYGAPAPGYPHPGVPPYYDPSQQQPLAMPGSVRAAQIVIFVTFGLGVLITVLVGAVVGAEEAGRFFSTYLMSVALFVLAFRYPKAGNGVRVASIVLASVQILFALSATAQGVPLGILPLGTAIAVVVLLSQGSAGRWFRRHRADGVPPQYAPYG
ncbi:hypothetical protein HTV45_11760 [Streptomyces sp. CHD11]|uniref:hypothetical protein n=1 Tax=Streptomyces sp. CHD11 TaxID=2741325 RepID=UPI001BFC49F5|nr:hypothetical protein [Streptomyces sp. CHD11]MBT3151551.1 hypothetical protein [Streptomyces sp. CHD11]